MSPCRTRSIPPLHEPCWRSWRRRLRRGGAGSSASTSGATSAGHGNTCGPSPCADGRAAAKPHPHEAHDRPGPRDHAAMAPRHAGGARRHRALANMARPSEAIFLTSGYAYDCAGRRRRAVRRRAAGHDLFAAAEPDGADAGGAASRCWKAPRRAATMASGMAAMTAALLCQLQTGDHVVAGRARSARAAG